MIELNGVRDALASLTPNAARFYRAPGQINLIGDYVEESEGFVLSIAIDRTTVLAAASRDDRTVRLHCTARDTTGEFSLEDLDRSAPLGWMEGVRQVARGLQQRGAVLRGTDLAVRTTIPPHAGLGSSAALSVASALALIGTAGVEMTVDDVVSVCRDVDRGAGSLTSAMGERDHALLTDSRSVEATTVPLFFDGIAIVVCTSHVARDTSEVEAQRRAQCAEAAQLLQPHVRRVRTLRDISLADFLRVSDKLPPILRRRTRHIVTENVRVLQTIAAIRAQDPVAVGGRLNESHDSLRDDYDLVSPELDLLVNAARSLSGVFGSRGAGRCGATISLIRRDVLTAFRTTVGAAYRAAFGRDVPIFEVRAADGASLIG